VRAMNEDRRAAKLERQRQRRFRATPLMRLGLLVGRYATWTTVSRELLEDALVHIDARMQHITANARGRSRLAWLERWQQKIVEELAKRQRRAAR